MLSNTYAALTLTLLHYKILCSKFNYLQITLKLGLNRDKDVLVKNNNFSQSMAQN